MSERKELLETIKEEREREAEKEELKQLRKEVDEMKKAGFDNCPDCGRLVSKHDRQCPDGNCGTLFK